MTSSNSSVPAIRLQNVRFSWTATVPILDIADLRIERGERMFVQGPSGSGKSTLLGLLGGVLVPGCGSVEVLGTDLAAVRAGLRDRLRADHIGFIFQQFNLLPFLNVLENTMLPCRFSARRMHHARAKSGSPQAEAERLLVALGLDPHALHGRSVRELSVGQQQRVAAARALIGAPEDQQPDEPTSALDEDVRRAFLALIIAECYHNRTTLVFVSHDASLAPLFMRSVRLADINRAAPAAA